jgi:hypothetical protein
VAAAAISFQGWLASNIANKKYEKGCLNFLLRLEAHTWTEK